MAIFITRIPQHYNKHTGTNCKTNEDQLTLPLVSSGGNACDHDSTVCKVYLTLES